MTRWPLLLVLPWAVVTTTSMPTAEGYRVNVPQYRPVGNVLTQLSCRPDLWDCSWQQDFVDAMNNAHERRKSIEEDAAYRKEHNGCFKRDCNTCCPSGGNGYNCTSMYCGDVIK